MGEKILVVDDDPDTLETLELLLETEGYSAIPARNGREGIEKAREEQPNLILLDIAMPDLDGLQVCEILRKDDATASVPIIFLTATKDLFVRAYARTLGAHEYICKPCDPDRLLARIRETLVETGSAS